MNFSRVSGSLILVFCLGIIGFAQSSPTSVKPSDEGRQVVVETDRFSGKTSVKLKPQTLIDTPDHKVALEMKSTDNVTSLSFESWSKDYFNFGDRELFFLVDGNRLRIDIASEHDTASLLQKTDEKGRTNFTSLTSSLTLSEVQAIAKSRKVEMRLGSLELAFNDSVMSQFREFANEFATRASSQAKPKGAIRQ